MDDIGEEDYALRCVTNNQDCCGAGTNNRRGEFHYPDESLVPTSSAGQDFYRNRGDQVIRLHRRNGARSPLGKYRCEILDANGVTQYLHINIGELEFVFIDHSQSAHIYGLPVSIYPLLSISMITFAQ